MGHSIASSVDVNIANIGEGRQIPINGHFVLVGQQGSHFEANGSHMSLTSPFGRSSATDAGSL